MNLQDAINKNKILVRLGYIQSINLQPILSENVLKKNIHTLIGCLRQEVSDPNSLCLIEIISRLETVKNRYSVYFGVDGLPAKYNDQIYEIAVSLPPEFVYYVEKIKTIFKTEV